MKRVVNGRLYGIYRALVVDAHDPKQTGRVKVHIPDIMPDKGGAGQWCTDGLWAHPANNAMGGRNTYDTKGPRCNHQDAWYQGQCLIPPKGSHVFLFFEKGDPSRPYYFAAADYGQTKVLPENRVGSAYEKKWTLMKSRLGRCIVVSDEDSYDGRVEITGKKRAIKRTPDGDTESVFNIDGNQTVFLIDERTGSHEKVFLKDYRGNYIKMIQDEAGRNDQLHIFMQDDIHIESLKNIYIKAHENIHVTATKNIYVTALDNMYVKVTNNFREMAKLIDRYAETDDRRYAGVNIYDKSESNIGQASNNVYQVGLSMCGRNCAGDIADMAGGGVSYSGGGVATLAGGGGAFLDGPTTGVNNGQSPITPPTGVPQASPSIKATPPDPDPSRHFTPTDDGWEPVASEENPQNKCHQKFWKAPQWQSLTPPSQCQNAAVNASGSGCSSGVTPSSSNSTSSGGNNSSSPATSGGGSSSNASSSNGNVFGTSGTVSNDSGNGGGIYSKQTQQQDFNITPQTESQIQPISIDDTIKNTIKSIPNVAVSGNDITDRIKNTMTNISKTVTEELILLSDKKNLLIDTMDNMILDEYVGMKPKIVSNVEKMIPDITLDKSKNAMSSIVPEDMSQNICPMDNINLIMDDAKDDFSSSLQYVIDLSKENVTRVLYGLLNGGARSYPPLYDCYQQTKSNIHNFIDNNSTQIVNNYRNVSNDYYQISKDVTQPLKTCSESICNDYIGIVNNGITATMDNELYDESFNNISIYVNDMIYNSGKLSYLQSQFMDDLYDCCCKTIDPSNPNYNNVVSECCNTFNDYMCDMNMDSYIDNIYKDSLYVTYDYCRNVVDIAYSMITEITFDTVTYAVFEVLRRNVDTFVSTCVSGTLNTIENYTFNTFSTIDTYSHNIVNTPETAWQLFNNNFIPQSNQCLCQYCLDNIPTTTPEACVSIANNSIQEQLSQCVDSSYPDLPSNIITSIVDNIPESKDVYEINVMTSCGYMIDKFIDSSIESVEPIDNVVNMKINSFNEIIDGKIYDEIISDINSDMYHIDYDLCIESLFDVNKDDNFTGGFSTVSEYIQNRVSTFINNRLFNVLSNICSNIIQQSNNIYNIPQIESKTINYSPLYSSLKNNIYKGISDSVMEEMVDSINNNINSSVDFKTSGGSLPFDDIQEDAKSCVEELSSYQNIIKESMLSGTDKTIDITKAISDEMDKQLNNLNSKVEKYQNPSTSQYQKNEDSKNNVKYGLIDSCVDIMNPLNETVKSINTNLYDNILNNVGESLKLPIVEIGTDPIVESLEEQKMTNGVIDSSGRLVYDYGKALEPYIFKGTNNLTETDKDNIEKICTDLNYDLDAIVNSREIISNVVKDPEFKQSILQILKDNGYPTKDTQKEKVKNSIIQCIDNCIIDIKNTLNTSFVIRVDNKNDFNKNVDLTRTYSIPGMPEKRTCVDAEKCTDCPESINSIIDENLYTNPLNYGGCGCIYEYALFLQDKFFKPLVWIYQHDNIGCTGISLNPDITKISTQDKKLIDDDIINDYNDLLQYFFNDIPTNLDDNKYLKHIDNMMDSLEILNINAVINLMDFSCRNYIWLQNMKEKDRYTHDMSNDKFKKFIKYIIDRVYYKTDSATSLKRRRTLLIFLNVGCSSYDNLSDPNRELFDVYPNCGFMRDLIMYLTYECGYTTNFMSISANEKDNIYYYNPYSEFKSYDDDIQHKLGEYEICIRDCVEGKKNGLCDIITYDNDGNINGGYFKYLTECNLKSIPLSYIFDFTDWMNKECKYSTKKQTIIEYYTKDNVIDPNIMNDILTPNFRSVLRYMYNGHDAYFTYTPPKFDKDGNLES